MKASSFFEVNEGLSHETKTGEGFHPANEQWLTGRGEAGTIDDFIERHSQRFTPRDLDVVKRLSPSLSRKALQAVTEGRYDLVLHIDQLRKVTQRARMRLDEAQFPNELREAGVALAYLIKGADIIPDFVEGLGLADDEFVVRRVMERNPSLKDGVGPE